MRPLPGLVALLALAAQPAVAAPQEAADSASIQETLRAFYFNLARRDWEAIAADVLSAKVLAHRPPPEILLAAARSAHRAAEVACGTRYGVLVEQAVLLPSGDWVEAFVPRCTKEGAGADALRLVSFDRRWRIVFIHLFDREVNAVTPRAGAAGPGGPPRRWNGPAPPRRLP